MLGSLAFSLYNYFACRPLVGRSVLRFLFSVLQGAKAPFPCRGVGQRLTTNQLIQPIKVAPLGLIGQQVRQFAFGDLRVESLV